MSKLSQGKLWILVNALALAGVLYVNYLANALPIAGRTPAEVSAMFPTLFTPAGFTFSIWGIIYLLLIAFAGYAFRFWGKPLPVFQQQIGWWFALSCIANAGWLFTFHHLHIGLSVLVMLVLLGSLLMIYTRLGIGRAAVSTAQRWLVHLPFSVYLGWISVATIANVAIWLTDLGWSGQPGGPVFWTVLILSVAVGLGLFMLWRGRDMAYALVLIWAFYGIYSRRLMDDAAVYDAPVEAATLAGIGLLAVAGLYRLLRR